MSQQINFYLPPVKARAEKCSASQIAAGLMLLFVVLAGLAGFEGYRNHKAGVQLASADEQFRLLVQRRTEIEVQLIAQANPGMDEWILKAEQGMEERSRLYDMLEKKVSSLTHGYSGYFVALARQHRQGLWLSNIKISGTGLSIELRGKALAADMVPRYLHDLAKESMLAGAKFHIFELNRPIDKEKAHHAKHIDFTISTEDMGDVI